MALDQVISVGSSLAAAAVIIVAGWRKGKSETWKDEAEAQKARADRLAETLDEIKERLERIEKENQRLVEILTALDPSRISASRV
jgi:Fe-S cluster assembly scaffold protein SufB